MTAGVEEEEIIDSRALTNACLLLFGEDTDASPAFINYMQMPGLKAAFRSLAMQNHPDLAAQTGIPTAELQRRFMAVRRAYDLLVPYVSGEKPLPPWDYANGTATCPRPAATPRPDFSRRTANRRSAGDSRSAGAPRPADSFTSSRPRTFFRGAVPGKELRFGEYLYYTGQIAWEDMFSALVWQRLNRPRLGEIALEKNMLSADDMMTIRRYKQRDELLGDAAVRLGLLDEGKLRLLLGFQRLYNCPIGRYFVDNRLITAAQLNENLREQRRHNLLFRAGRG